LAGSRRKKLWMHFSALRKSSIKCPIGAVSAPGPRSLTVPPRSTRLMVGAAVHERPCKKS
jgi:hypothetical protein